MTDPIALALQVDRFVRRLHGGIHARATAVDHDRIGPMGGMILMALAERERTPLHRLVEDFARDKSQMTRMVRTLEDKGMLDRAPCPDDGRVTLLGLTPKGRAFVAQISSLMAEVVDDLLAPVPPEDRAAFAAILDRL
ncbi:MAG: MarR family transcriptional regulator [Pseudomonadota bacterium]